MKKYLPELFLFALLGYLLFLIRPAIQGELRGTFRVKEVPPEYLVLKDFLSRQPDFFRTFWAPKQPRFGFFSHQQPAIFAENFLTASVCKEPFCSLKVAMPAEWGEKCSPAERCYVRELSYFLNPQTAEILAALAVKYVLVPSDPEGEIFIAERKYNHQQREEVENFLDTLPWLKKIEVADKIAVYELSGFKDHFFLDLSKNASANELKSWKMINPTKYVVSLKINEAPANLVFSEVYDELWQVKVESERISSQEYLGILNSFLINQTGDFEVVVELAGQKYVYFGLIISGIAVFILLLYYLLTSGRVKN